MSNANMNDRNNDELSQDEIDNVAGGVRRNDDANSGQNDRRALRGESEDELNENELGNVAGGVRRNDDDQPELLSRRNDDENSGEKDRRSL